MDYRRHTAMTEKKPKKLKLKKDRFVSSRGNPHFINIFCSQCGEWLALYQKDGKGRLFRLYFDRIFEPESLTKFQGEQNISKIPPFLCPGCKKMIGTPMRYIKNGENRLAYRLIRGSIITKRVSKKIKRK